MFRDICEGLSHAHKNRVIHGNLRPSNVLITETGKTKVTDFGLKDHYSSDKNKINWYRPAGEPKSTSLDIFAVGVIFYQILTGLEPNWSKGRLVLASQFRQLPIKIQMIILRMTSIDPADRYDNLTMIIDKINSVLEQKESREDIKEKMPLRTILIILFFLAAGIAVFFLTR